MTTRHTTSRPKIVTAAAIAATSAPRICPRRRIPAHWEKFEIQRAIEDVEMKVADDRPDLVALLRSRIRRARREAHRDQRCKQRDDRPEIRRSSYAYPIDHAVGISCKASLPYARERPSRGTPSRIPGGFLGTYAIFLIELGGGQDIFLQWDALH